jgi:hypothetical protein
MASGSPSGVPTSSRDPACRAALLVMERTGIEPVTSGLQSRKRGKRPKRAVTAEAAQNLPPCGVAPLSRIGPQSAAGRETESFRRCLGVRLPRSATALADVLARWETAGVAVTPPPADLEALIRDELREPVAPPARREAQPRQGLVIGVAWVRFDGDVTHMEGDRHG